MMKATLLVALLASALADIPAHCLQKDVLGTWKFQLSAPIADPTSVSLTCDQLDVLPYATDITLSVPTHAVDESGNKGTWTMVYDQGFEVTIPDRQDPTKNRVYFHFMHYETHGQNVTTDCGKSLRGFGWVHDAMKDGKPAESVLDKDDWKLKAREGMVFVEHGFNAIFVLELMSRVLADDFITYNFNR